MTKKHLELGKAGEDLAAAWIGQKGYRIVERNYRAGRGEIDLIAWQGDALLVFFEVKTRSSESFGGPEQGVDRKKQALIQRTAAQYMEKIGYDWAIRFDTIAIVIHPGNVPEMRHIEDAFY